MLAEQIFDEALALPREKREELAECLSESLGAEEDEFHLSEGWKQELRRRVEEIRSGKVQGIPVEDVFAKLRCKFA